MPTTGSADEVGHALEPAIQPVAAIPGDRPALLVERPLDEGLLAGFLLGYRHHTRAAYLADLRDFRVWCANVGIGLLEVHRIHVEAYVGQLEQAGRSHATVARRLATLASFYRYVVQEGALPHSPVTHVRRPPVARDSQTLGLDREEAVRFLAAAQAASARDHALVGGTDGMGDFADGGSGAVAVGGEDAEDGEFTSLMVVHGCGTLRLPAGQGQYRTYFRIMQSGVRQTGR